MDEVLKNAAALRAKTERIEAERAPIRARAAAEAAEKQRLKEREDRARRRRSAKLGKDFADLMTLHEVPRIRYFRVSSPSDRFTDWVSRGALVGRGWVLRLYSPGGTHNEVSTPTVYGLILLTDGSVHPWRYKCADPDAEVGNHGVAMAEGDVHSFRTVDRTFGGWDEVPEGLASPKGQWLLTQAIAGSVMPLPAADQ